MPLGKLPRLDDLQHIYGYDVGIWCSNTGRHVSYYSLTPPTGIKARMTLDSTTLSWSRVTRDLSCDAT